MKKTHIKYGKETYLGGKTHVQKQKTKSILLIMWGKNDMYGKILFLKWHMYGIKKVYIVGKISKEIKYVYRNKNHMYEKVLCMKTIYIEIQMKHIDGK